MAYLAAVDIFPCLHPPELRPSCVGSSHGEGLLGMGKHGDVEMRLNSLSLAASSFPMPLT